MKKIYYEILDGEKYFKYNDISWRYRNKPIKKEYYVALSNVSYYLKHKNYFLFLNLGENNEETL